MLTPSLSHGPDPRPSHLLTRPGSTSCVSLPCNPHVPSRSPPSGHLHRTNRAMALLPAGGKRHSLTRAPSLHLSASSPRMAGHNRYTINFC